MPLTPTVINFFMTSINVNIIQISLISFIGKNFPLTSFVLEYLLAVKMNNLYGDCFFFLSKCRAGNVPVKITNLGLTPKTLICFTAQPMPRNIICCRGLIVSEPKLKLSDILNNLRHTLCLKSNIQTCASQELPKHE